MCESTAGCPLSELFDVYAATTRNVDCRKYLAYAGFDLEPDFTITPLPHPDSLQSQMRRDWLKD